MAKLNPIKGSEQGGTRPVVIISGNTMNDSLPVVIACALSSKIKGYPGCVVVKARKESGLKQDSEVIVFQVRTLAHVRLIKRVGLVRPNEFREIMNALQEVLLL